MNLFAPFRKKAVLRGEVCRIHLILAGTSDKQTEDLQRETVKAALPQLEQQLTSSLSESFGEDFGSLCVISQGREVVIKVNAASYVVKSCRDFKKGLTLFTSHARELFTRILREKLEHTVVRGYWTPSPALIRTELAPPEKYSPFFRQLVKHPAVLVLLGAALGSYFLPKIQSSSNDRKVRHDERIKWALAIIDQNRETSRELVDLHTALALFVKDHANPKEKNSKRIRTQQYEARERYNIQYLTFGAQAWWWYWTTQMKAQLSALATPDEARQIQNLATLYDKQLRECVADLVDPWERILRDPYYPASWDNSPYKIPLEQAKTNLDRHNSERDALAIKMAEVFASD